jgi:hypothetical protein
VGKGKGPRVRGSREGDRVVGDEMNEPAAIPIFDYTFSCQDPTLMSACF